MKVINQDGARPIKAWVGAKTVKDYNGSPFPTELDQEPTERVVLDIEDEALTQLKNLSRLPFIAPNGVAAMPDVHAGKGSTIGSVIATDKAIIPAAVGVDIGCGVNAVRLSLKASDLPDSLKAIRAQIERDVPNGFGQHGDGALVDISGMMAVKTPPSSVVDGIFGGDYEKARKKFHPQLGTLGGGNHFIELCIDENQDVWVMLHSGSRGIGNMIGSYFIEKAKRRMEQYFIHLPDGDLAYLPEGTEDFNDYVEAVNWAQSYALENRRVMMDLVIAALRRHIPIEFTITQEAINCHHNYVEKENHFGRNLWVTRKGAIRARAGDLGIIPGSMGQKSYIVRGKGSLESYCSCSHGAGRKMSRTAARKRFTIEDLKAQTQGVECRKDSAVIDEIPGSYKDIDTVMENQKDLVEVVHVLRAVLCVKGA